MEDIKAMLDAGGGPPETVLDSHKWILASIKAGGPKELILSNFESDFATNSRSLVGGLRWQMMTEQATGQYPHLKDCVKTAVEWKEEGNRLYGKGVGSAVAARWCYNKGIQATESLNDALHAILLTNMAAAMMLEERYEDAFGKCICALVINPSYLKAYYRAITAAERADPEYTSAGILQGYFELGLQKCKDAASDAAYLQLGESIKKAMAFMKKKQQQSGGGSLKNKPPKGTKVKCVKGLGNYLEEIDVDCDSEVFTKSFPSPPMTAAGFPFALLCPNLGGMQDNQVATYFMIDIETGFAPPQFQGRVGEVIFCRKDFVPVTKADVFLVYDFLCTVLDHFADGYVPSDWRKEFLEWKNGHHNPTYAKIMNR